MPVLPRHDHPLVARALAEARRLCHGRIIDDRPALAHAVAVAITLGRHLPHPAPTLVAAVLLHDAPEFAPPQLDLDQHLTDHYGEDVARIVRALQREHTGLDTQDPVIDTHDRAVVLASTADKIVAFESLVQRAAASADPSGFFATRPALLALLPHFTSYHQAVATLVPASMARHHATALHALQLAATRPGPPTAPG